MRFFIVSSAWSFCQDSKNILTSEKYFYQSPKFIIPVFQSSLSAKLLSEDNINKMVLQNQTSIFTSIYDKMHFPSHLTFYGCFCRKFSFQEAVYYVIFCWRIKCRFAKCSSIKFWPKLQFVFQNSSFGCHILMEVKVFLFQGLKVSKYLLTAAPPLITSSTQFKTLLKWFRNGICGNPIFGAKPLLRLSHKIYPLQNSTMTQRILFTHAYEKSNSSM